MKFRNDIEPENTWVTSDSHFGHENIVDYCARPLDHDQVMIAEWRAQVPESATVLHLGDLCYKGNAYFKNVIAPELTGARKLLVLGNHDRNRFSWYRDCGFQVVRPFGVVFGNPYSPQWVVSFSHYAWNEAEEGKQQVFQWRVHGHIHNNGYVDTKEGGGRYTPFLRNHINVSVEQTRYRPVNLKVLLDAAILGRLS